jgi:predicted  nucleic acid-binding Zn-ribbon protein
MSPASLSAHAFARGTALLTAGLLALWPAGFCLARDANTAPVLRRLEVMDKALAEQTAPEPAASHTPEPTVVTQVIEVPQPVLTAWPSARRTGSGFSTSWALGLLAGVALLWLTRRRWAQRIQREMGDAVASAAALKEAQQALARMDLTLQDARHQQQAAQEQYVAMGVKLGASLEDAEAYRRELAGAQKSDQALRYSLLELQARLEQGDQRAQQADAQLSALRAQLQTLEQERARALEEMAEAQAQWTAQYDARMQLEAQLAQSQEQLLAARQTEVLSEISPALAQRLTEELEALRAAHAQLQQAHAESEWYLGEERQRLLAAQQQHDALREQCAALTAAQDQARLELVQAGQARDEANWYLGELKTLFEQQRAVIPQLHAQKDQLHTQLQDTQASLAGLKEGVAQLLERARQAGYDLWTGEERRQEPRLGPPLTLGPLAELLDSATGRRVSRGTITNLSARGLGLKLPFLPALARLFQGRARCRMTPAEEGAAPLELEGRVVWQRRQGTTAGGEIGLAFEAPLNFATPS